MNDRIRPKLDEINERTEVEASEFAQGHPVRAFRRELDGTIYAFECLKCGYRWKVYQNACSCHRGGE